MAQDKWLEVLGWGKGEVDDLRYVAYSYIKQGIYDIALTFFDAIQVLSTPTAYDLQTLGALHLQMGDGGKALHFLDRALSLDPSHMASKLNRAKALLMVGKKIEALHLAKELSELGSPEIASQATALLLANH
jgi:tetratricopeptide (TPR) repeat protein